MNLNHELVDLGRGILKEHYPQLELLHIEVIQCGGIKTIWKLETTSGTLCLKRIRKSLPIVRFTTSAQAFLYNKGARVAGIIPAKDDQLYCVHEGYGLVVYTWIDGRELEMDENPEHFYSALAGLAQFHVHTCGFLPPEDFEVYDRMGVWTRHYTEMIQELKGWKTLSEQDSSPFHRAYNSTVDEMVAMAEQALLLLQASCYEDWVQTIGKGGYMCHQDYGKGNALQTDQGVYILDLDNLAYDIPFRDVRKLIIKRWEKLERWDKKELEQCVGCYTSILSFTIGQKQVLYTDLLFPHTYYGEAKNPFKKGKAGEARKILDSSRFEKSKLSVLGHFIQI